eukprot:15335418-Ditylum_brightwellii.AAC.1
MSADSWTRKAPSSSVTGKALMRLQCALLLNNPVDLNAEWITRGLNTIPDYISCYKEKTNNLCKFDCLKQVFPELTCCQHFHPSKELLSMIFDTMLNNYTMDPTRPISKLGHIGTE